MDGLPLQRVALRNWEAAATAEHWSRLWHGL